MFPNSPRALCLTPTPLGSLARKGAGFLPAELEPLLARATNAAVKASRPQPRRPTQLCSGPLCLAPVSLGLARHLAAGFDYENIFLGRVGKFLVPVKFLVHVFSLAGLKLFSPNVYFLSLFCNFLSLLKPLHPDLHTEQPSSFPKASSLCLVKSAWPDRCASVVEH